MTSTTTRPLSPLLQRLIDERLDGIDRALRMAGTGRGDRMQIVEEVERQLWDMLAQAPGEPSRRDVLNALSRLDPPEAYLPEEVRSDVPPEPSLERRSPPRLSKLAVLSAILIVLGALSVPIGVGWNGEILVLGGLLLVVGLMSAIASAIRIRSSSGRLQGEKWTAFALTVGGLYAVELAILMLASMMSMGMDEMFIIAWFARTWIIAALAVVPVSAWLRCTQAAN